MFIITLKEAIGLLIFAIVFLIYILHLAVDSFYKFKKWKKSGFCRHEWELYSTKSAGNFADFKCKHCNEVRLKRL